MEDSTLKKIQAGRREHKTNLFKGGTANYKQHNFLINHPNTLTDTLVIQHHDAQ